MNLSGNGYKKSIEFTEPPKRVVSLVPSLTESLFDLGFGSSLVAVTDFCIYPEGSLDDLPKIGGPKTPDITRIIELNPDLVLANKEENQQSDVELLEQAGIKVWTTFPRNAREAVDVLWILVGIFHSSEAAARLETLEIALDWAESSLRNQESWRYFCPIWYQENKLTLPEWWMTFNQNTYINDVLRLMGGENVFAGRLRRFPIEAEFDERLAEEPDQRDTRYPRVGLQEIMEANPQVVILPSEPYQFTESHVELYQDIFTGTPAGLDGKILKVDGSLLSWHGTRLGRTLTELPAVFNLYNLQ